jgi:hypothetical protein
MNDDCHVIADHEDPRYCKVSIEGIHYMLIDLVEIYSVRGLHPNKSAVRIAEKFFRRFPEKLI